VRADRLAALVLALCALVFVAAPAGAAGGAKALDEYFHGKVTALKGRTVTLRYDFRDKDQLQDFVDFVPFRIAARKEQGIRWYDSKLEIIGNAGARHKAAWSGPVTVTATFVPHLEKDFGGYLSPVSGTEDFATFTFVETYFHRFDGKAGGTNSIIKFGPQWKTTSGGGFTGFRYGPRKPPKEKIQVGKEMRASFGTDLHKLFFRPPDDELSGREMGKPLRHFFVGFYAINGRLLLDDVEIQGELDRAWLKRENVELRTVKPIEAVDTSGPDEATRALIQAHKKGGDAAATRKLLSILQDPNTGPAVRDAVLAALEVGPKKTAQYAVDLLYHADEHVRDMGIHIIKAHLGKDYGYRARSSEKRRRKAIQKLQADIEKHPDLLEGTTSE
jgi:hypothetical protein